MQIMNNVTKSHLEQCHIACSLFWTPALIHPVLVKPYPCLSISQVRKTILIKSIKSLFLSGKKDNRNCLVIEITEWQIQTLLHVSRNVESRSSLLGLFVRDLHFLCVYFLQKQRLKKKKPKKRIKGLYFRFKE